MLKYLHLAQRLIACCVLWLSLSHAPADAAVEIRFYSKELGASFPHAFVELEGQDDRTGEKVHANYGFTAKAISPAILLGSVTGEVMSVDAGYVRSSDRHFSIVLTDAEYDKVKATIEKWRQLKQPSYNLNRQNCVFFVGDVAASLGMRADTPKELMKKPRSYTEFLVTSNRSWLAARGASLDTRYAGNGK
ncbi:MAG: hypothetical protein M3N39_12675 [Pseudomonadota bacterium]|nr:hypothetical protein [Pseudomonadota bacterium]